MTETYDLKVMINLYRTMLKIRMFEDTASMMYKKGEIKGFIHCYQGEEAVASGVCEKLKDTDVITSTHRGHGHVIAKGCSLRELMAELFGRSTGMCGGRGGSMHLYDMEHGLLGTNGMVGGGLGLAVGAGYAFKYKKKENVAVCFFGDGASNMGIFYEAINLAAIWKLPVIFVCENNLYATSTPLEEVAANPEIASRARLFNIPGGIVNGNDVLDVYRAAVKAIERALNNGGPTLIEAKTYRFHGHHEGDQLYGTYRTKEELETWKLRCPIENFKKVLQIVFGIDNSLLEKIGDEIKQEIDDAVEFARNSPLPDPASVSKNIFKEE